VALTFDDGPGDDTAALLDVLKVRGVRATFFVIGTYAAIRPDLVARAAAEGHLVGDHTWHHAYPRQLSGGWSRSYLHGELSRTDQVISAATGGPVCWFRPPGGFLPPAVLPVTHELGLQVALWSVDPRDWQLQPPNGASLRLSPKQITDTIVSRAAAGLSQPHPVILMHDGGGSRRAGLAAVPRIIELYRSHGYRFVRLDGVTPAPG
jgi:peptidoglycan/xylan/chitin deacetylase (PgdA/CDA1 family)